ncbi:hypothetical protein [Salinisphaera hydrothermalis]|uniref:Uncharacterized protein n=1 Tax=Salinisphaera hydrothermalis (strain C41B8) TaxID=1304275 RepID=A0A084IIF7_SALHC|nr:hypothetical protein [Salinisphaera hydrothermalis]KEZ76491.1 hypothetical protein C41B8_14645 [Salinisphaera hydrothermalis C41B8]
MAYTDDTPMKALLAGMASVDADACHEFARRQHVAGYGPDLATAAALIHDLAFAAQLERPDELLAWKYPETFTPIDTEVLTQLLQAASENDRETGAALIAEQSFADITALSSIASYLSQACEQLRRFGARTPDPQQPLF